MQELISIIVPVYRVEKYLKQCVDSILAQTYQNLEILLVDDGSPDRCGEICDAYAQKDARIRVLHQENRGISAARNAGLSAARGEYIGFVDSDDYVDSDMFASLYNALQESGKQIAQCALIAEYPKKGIREGYHSTVTFSQHEAIRELLNDRETRNYVWNKLYRRSCWEGIEFPVGKVFEDIHATYRVFLKSNGLISLPQAFYHYRQNSQGITRSKQISNSLNLWEATRQRRLDLQERYPECREIMYRFELFCHIEVWSTVFHESKQELQKYMPMLEKMAEETRENITFVKSMKEAYHLHLGGRTQIFLIQHAKPWAFSCLPASSSSMTGNVYCGHPAPKKKQKTALRHFNVLFGSPCFSEYG